MKPALEFRSEGFRTATGNGVVVLSLEDKSIRLNGVDVEALVRVLRAADFLAEHGYVSGMTVDSPNSM